MPDLQSLLTNDDLLAMIRTLAPESTDPLRMVRALREDEEILQGMLANEKLFASIAGSPESFVHVSPRLFFLVLLVRVKRDLASRPFTLETDERHRTAVFDSHEVVALMEQKPLLAYLADMLASFVRIESFTMPVRVKPGVWRKLRFSDYDIDSLLEFSSLVDEEKRFPAYKRIADVCMFTTGVFPGSLPRPEEALKIRTGGGALERRSSRDLVTLGKSYYRAAARHQTARELELSQVLEKLSEVFTLAVKPLTHLSTHVLGPMRERVFLRR